MTVLAAAEVDRVFTALADPTRRRLLEVLGGRRASSATTLAGQLPVTRQAVVQHLAVLAQAELVTSRKSGREVLYTVAPDRMVAAASWMTALADAWDQRLQLLKRMAEEPDPE